MSSPEQGPNHDMDIPSTASSTSPSFSPTFNSSSAPAQCEPAGIPTSVFSLFLRCGLGGLFVFSAWQKLKPGNPPEPAGSQTFALSVKAFEILPDSVIPYFASGIAWTELLCAIALIIGLYTRAATTILILAVISFTIGVFSVIQRGLPITCGCFGKFKLLCEGPVSWCKVGENSIFLLALVILFALNAGRFAMDACVAGQDKNAKL